MGDRINHLNPSIAKCRVNSLLPHSFNGRRLKEDNLYDKMNKYQRSEKVVMEMDSDEEFKVELEKAVKACKKNKQIDKSNPYASKKTLKQENEKIYDNAMNDTLMTQGNFNTERNNNGDAFADITELINYFFLPKKIHNFGRNIKSYSEYEKQGAIPKNRVKNDSNEINSSRVMDLMAILRSRETNRSNDKSIHGHTSLSESMAINQSLNTHCDDGIVKVSEETCFKPFFYIVPENPSPNFFLPRGSYYIIPEVPSSSTAESIVFHPERGAHSKSKLKCRQTSENHSKCIEINNLSKNTLDKLDSHLNIGPRDVRLNDSTNNLETNCSANKIYQKNLESDNNSEDGVTSADEVFDLEVSDQGLQDDKADNSSITEIRNEKLNNLIQTLASEFSDWSMTKLSNIAQEYLNDEIGLEQFLAPERLERKIKDQFERLVLTLPENDRSVLLQKCKTFKGNEELLNAYIEEVQLANKLQQHVLDMQCIFPDADPEFLLAEIRKLGDNAGEISGFTLRLLESGDYPKIPEDKKLAERKKLWNKYVVNFSVEKYLRNVTNPERFAGPAGNNNKADEDIILKYLRSRYLSTNLNFLQIFRNNDHNLTKTCDSLNLTEAFGPLENSFQNESFDEEFLKEICYIEHKEEIDSFLNEIKERKEIEREDARLNDCFLYCPLCSDDELIASEVVPCPEGHVFCIQCIKRYFFVKFADGVYKFECPSEMCESFFTFSVLENLLPEKILSKILQKQQAEEISAADVEGMESCPHCEFTYIPNPGDNIFRCQNPDCLTETCRKCHEKNHIPLRCEELERPLDVEARKRIEETMTSQLIRVCPKCQKKIVKIDGCNKMSCTCGTLFCYVCRCSITGYDHFHRGVCPLYSNNEKLHNEDVVAAGIQTRNEILRENPNIRIFNDPTNSHDL